MCCILLWIIVLCDHLLWVRNLIMAAIEKREAKGGITYRVKVRLKGFPTQTATFTRLTDAKKWAQHTESAIREGRYFKSAESRKHTLADAIDRYIETVLVDKPKCIKDQGTQLRWWKERLGQYVLADVAPALIVEQRDRLLRGKTVKGVQRSPSTVNRYLAILSHVFTTALKEWGWVEENPLRKVSKKTEPKGRVRYLSDDERERLLQACKDSDNPYLHMIVVLCLSTGARKMEILGLKWSDININRGTITLYETKNGDTRVLPLTGYALKLFKEHAKVRKLKNDYVFPSDKVDKPMDIRAPWEKALKKAEIDNFKFHDLRHTAASYLAMNGATLAEIAGVLGHKTLQMVKRYAHLSDPHTASVVSKMNERIFG